MINCLNRNCGKIGCKCNSRWEKMCVKCMTKWCHYHHNEIVPFVVWKMFVSLLAVLGLNKLAIMIARRNWLIDGRNKQVSSLTILPNSTATTTISMNSVGQSVDVYRRRSLQYLSPNAVLKYFLFIFTLRTWITITSNRAFNFTLSTFVVAPKIWIFLDF